MNSKEQISEKISRRDFLRMGGLAAVALATGKVWKAEARPVHEGNHLEREDLSQIIEIFPVSIENGTVFPLIKINDSIPYHKELTRLQEHLQEHLVVALRSINITPEYVRIFIPARGIKKKPELLVHMPPILTEDSSSEKDAEVQILPTLTAHPEGKGKGKGTTERIEAFSIVYGKRNKTPVTLGLLLTPNAGSDGWNFITSQAQNLYKAAYGPKDNNDRKIIAVPSPQEKKVLAFEYTKPDRPLRLVSIGTPDKKGKEIIWHSARREHVAGRELTVSSNNPRITILDIHPKRIELVYNLLAQLSREDRGSFQIPDRPVRWEINYATRSAYPLKKEELNPQRILVFTSGPSSENNTIIHMNPFIDNGTIVYAIHPTEKFLQGFNYTPDQATINLHLSSWLAGSIIFTIAVANGVFGLNAQTPDGISDRRIRRFWKHLYDHGYNTDGPLFDLQYDNPKLS